jgi:HSP20 family protein
MNTLTRWDPFKDLDELQNRLATIFGRTPVRFETGQKELMTVADWAPLVDVVEDDKEYLIKVELPEVKKEDVKVSMNEEVLTITGERTKMKEEGGKKFHRVERFYGSFARSFAVPRDADGTKLLAEFKEGILKIHLPKSEKAKPRNVEIVVA